MAALKLDHVPLATLAALLQRISADYHQRGIDSVNLSARDFYRAFGTEEMFEIYADVPSPISVGSLHDDIDELSKLLADPDRTPTSVDIERLGNVLRAVSEVV